MLLLFKDTLNLEGDFGFRLQISSVQAVTFWINSSRGNVAEVESSGGCFEKYEV